MFDVFKEQSVSIVHLLDESLPFLSEMYPLFGYHSTQSYPEYFPGTLILHYGSSTFEIESAQREISRLSQITLSLFDTSASGVFVRWVTGHVGTESFLSADSPIVKGLHRFPDGSIRFKSATDIIHFLETYIEPRPVENTPSQWVLAPTLDTWVDKTLNKVQSHLNKQDITIGNTSLIDEVTRIISAVKIV